MLRLAADENLNNDIVRGLLRRNSAIDIVCIQDVGLSGADDSAVLAWAAGEGRVLVTHDVSTITRHAYERVETGQPMPGVFEADQDAPLGGVIEDLELLAQCSLENEWEGRISCAASVGVAEVIDTRADVYSLGVMLYEVSCVELPFTTQQLKAGSARRCAGSARSIRRSRARSSCRCRSTQAASRRRCRPRPARCRVRYVATSTGS